MDLHGSATLLLLLLCVAWSTSSPLPEDQIDKYVAKRTLDDTPPLTKSILNPYMGMYPGMMMKPFGPLFAQAMLMNSLAANTNSASAPAELSSPTVDPVAAYFKAKKDEFINKLLADIIADSATSEVVARAVTEDLPTDDETATTPKPKIDPSIFLNKKMSFLSTLFKVLNSTTPAPVIDPADPTATTVKPTIVPPTFWDFGFGLKPPKPSKPPKEPKTEKPPKAEKPVKITEIDPITEFLNAETSKFARSALLDKLFHVTEATPTKDEDLLLAARGLASFGNSIPTDGTTGAKRSIAPGPTDPTSMILAQLQSLKNDIILAYTESMKAKAASKPPIGKKLPPWAAKSTPVVPDAIQQKMDVLSKAFDSLAAVEKQLVSVGLTTESSVIKKGASVPTAGDSEELNKEKTQAFLAQLFSENASEIASG